MVNRPQERLIGIINSFGDNDTTRQFLSRVRQGQLSRDENPQSHFCVYFAAHDPVTKQVYIGHHIKSGLWIFNGGHFDQGETPNEAVKREMGEEWGKTEAFAEPSLLTITNPNNPGHPCRQHFDVWYFIPIDSYRFHPDPAKLATEFTQTKLASTKEARRLITDHNTIKALNLIESGWFLK